MADTPDNPVIQGQNKANLMNIHFFSSSSWHGKKEAAA